MDNNAINLLVSIFGTAIIASPIPIIFLICGWDGFFFALLYALSIWFAIAAPSRGSK